MILATFATMGCLTGNAAEPARLLRFPATNGTDVVFTYAGDLYSAPLSGGEARRLTSHKGIEIFPKFSPDGKNVAFTGQYDGNTEVYLIPADGGEPKRLTFTSTNSRDDLGDRMGPNNIVVAWTPDGSEIVYRNRIGDGFDGKLWQVAPQGGMPSQIPLPEGGFASFSPDGKKMAYNRVMREFRTWKYYRGGMADDVWIYDPEAKTVVNITDNPAQDIFPMWVGDEIFFISDRDMTMNFFVYNTKTGKTEKVTEFSDFDVKFPSSDGKRIVFEKGGWLYTLDPATRQTRKIDITLASDNLQARTKLKDVADKLTSFGSNPDGSRLLLTARGEVFDVPVEKGVTRNLTRSSDSNDRDASWSPDGSKIAFIADKTGESEIWVRDAGDSQPRQLTHDNDTYIRSLTWSPDSKTIVYTDRKNRVVAVDPATGKKRTLFTNPAHEVRGVAFSPDSKWIAYTRSGDNNMGVVYVRELATGKEIPVTEKWYNSSSPEFSTDGKYLIFFSERDFNPNYSETEWNHSFNRMGGVYLAMLSADTPSPFLAYDGKRPEEADKKGGPVEVKIDADGLSQRLVKLPLKAGYYGGFHSDGKKVWYSSMAGTEVFDLASGKNETVAPGAMMAVNDKGDKAVFYSDGKLYVTALPSGKASLDSPVDLSAMTAEVDYSKEWPQIFDEVWRAFRDGFYLENMHGVDWNAMKEKYGQLLPYVKTRLDLNYVIGEMISELACGHAYVNPGEMEEAPRVSMGLLGAELSRDKGGNYRIDRIIPGDVYSRELRSPLAEPGLGVKAGDFIVAIDGISVKETENIYSLLSGKAGVLTELTVSASADGSSPRKVVVEPIADEYPLYHHEWVQGNIEKVDKATGGKVGYIYIPDMGPAGLKEFARLYYPQLDKEALIIDDRANGGGNISPMVIERLLREPYRMTMSRTSDKNGTIPDATHVGPKVLLINKYSASDGDLFPWSFKANNLGTVIGTRTWGGIIGISGSLPYVDGTDVRVPFFTNYDAKTGQWIVENHGVDPDILIDNDPIKEQAGEDQQLNKAIEVALEQLKTRKAMPKTPAPRTFKDLGL